MESHAILQAKELLLLLGIVLGSGMLAGFVARLLRLPDVVLFLLTGMLLGHAGLGLVNVGVNTTLNQLLLIFGSCYILFDGGASVRLSVLRGVWPTLLIISTIGLLITAIVTAFAAHWLLGMPLLAALLLGATIGSTDPATLVPIFKQVRIRARVSQTVMSESAFNDAMGAILTFTLLGLVMGQQQFSLTSSLLALLQESLLGLLGGIVLGYLAVLLIAHKKYGFLAEYAPLVTLMTVATAYLTADNLQASGFMAVFAFGIVVGNMDLLGFKMSGQDGQEMEDYILTTSLLMRIFIFILLGSQVDFALLQQYFWQALGIVLVFILIARPLTVFISAWPDRRARWQRNELLFMCWTRETGVIPGALAGILVGMQAPYADIIAAITFMAILLTILLQATTTRWLAAKLGLLD